MSLKNERMEIDFDGLKVFFLAQHSSEQKQKTVGREAHFLCCFPPVKGKPWKYSVPSLKSLWK